MENILNALVLRLKNMNKVKNLSELAKLIIEIEIK